MSCSWHVISEILAGLGRGGALGVTRGGALGVARGGALDVALVSVIILVSLCSSGSSSIMSVGGASLPVDGASLLVGGASFCGFTKCTWLSTRSATVLTIPTAYLNGFIERLVHAASNVSRGTNLLRIVSGDSSVGVV